MDNKDGHAFLEFINAVSEYYGKPKLSDQILKMYFGGLAPYSFEQVQNAVNQHMQDPEHGQFMPKVADIIRYIRGGGISTDHIISSARLAKTPLGILCRIQIGTFDLEHNKDPFYLKARAQECLDLLPGWIDRAVRGDYTNHEISIMVKHGVNPTAPFDVGLQAPQDRVWLQNKVNAVCETPRHKYLLEVEEKPVEGENAGPAPEVKAFLEKI